MSDAELLLRSRNAHAGGVVEMVVWRVPRPVRPAAHAFKYRLVFVRGGERLVGYDNERGKGDHKHLLGQQMVYVFVDIDRLIADFLGDVEKLS
jgi:hypothetical protein